MKLSRTLARFRPSTRIPLKLKNGWRHAIVDPKDAELAKHAWHAVENRGKFYARRVDWNDGNPKRVYLHREIMGVGFGSGVEVDHINGNSLDCRRANLRVATRTQQGQNARRPDHNTSGYKGVASSRGRWRAFIKLDQRQRHLGCFRTRAEAARAYDAAALELFGEFARLNFPPKK